LKKDLAGAITDYDAAIKLKPDYLKAFQVREAAVGECRRLFVADDIANDVRTILGGLNSVVSGVGALRTHGGDAHGRERG
jgi:hypothetical protein